MCYCRCHFVLKDETGTFKRFKSQMKNAKGSRDQGLILKCLKKKKKKTLSYLLDHPKTDKQGVEKDRIARKISKYNSYSSGENEIKL